MSWLYTIVVAGLLFSSNTDPVLNTKQSASTPEQTARVSLQDETERIEQTYPLNPNGRVSVSNVNGSIVVEAWDRSEVKLEATKIADSKETLADVEIKVDSRPDHLSVETDYKSWNWGDKNERNRQRKLEVQFRLWVPRTALLNEIETVNGSVTVQNFVNYTKISAVNGNVNASNLRGAADLSTVNGEVIADFDQLESGSKISLSTVNGRVNLMIPSDANATIKADSLNGEIKNDFGLPVRKGQYIGRDMYGRVGNGGVDIKLNSVNGGLAIGRKNHGKSPNPATNLLPQKGRDDEDWDGAGVVSAVDAAKIDRDVARAVRESQRQSARSMRDAHKAMVKVKPELDKLKIKEMAKIEGMEIELDKVQLEKTINQAVKLQDSLGMISMAAWPSGPPMIEKKRNSFPVKGTPKVTINAKGCALKVRGWNKSEVQYVITEISGRRDREPISVAEDHKDSSVTLTIENPNEELRNGSLFDESDRVRIEVFVPRKSNLQITTDGEIRLDGVSGDIELNGEDEAINIRDVDGKLRLLASDGHVRVIGFKGELNTQTCDADVFLEGDFQKLSAKAADGTIVLTVPKNANADFYSNTEIEANGLDLSRENENTWRLGRGGATYNFDFTDGKLVLRNAAELNTY